MMSVVCVQIKKTALALETKRFKREGSEQTFFGQYF